MNYRRIYQVPLSALSAFWAFLLTLFLGPPKKKKIQVRTIGQKNLEAIGINVRTPRLGGFMMAGRMVRPAPRPPTARITPDGIVPIEVDASIFMNSKQLERFGYMKIRETSYEKVGTKPNGKPHFRKRKLTKIAPISEHLEEWKARPGNIDFQVITNFFEKEAA